MVVGLNSFTQVVPRNFGEHGIPNLDKLLQSLGAAKLVV